MHACWIDEPNTMQPPAHPHIHFMVLGMVARSVYGAALWKLITYPLWYLNALSARHWDADVKLGCQMRFVTKQFHHTKYRLLYTVLTGQNDPENSTRSDHLHLGRYTQIVRSLRATAYPSNIAVFISLLWWAPLACFGAALRTMFKQNLAKLEVAFRKMFRCIVGWVRASKEPWQSIICKWNNVAAFTHALHCIQQLATTQFPCLSNIARESSCATLPTKNQDIHNRSRIRDSIVV